MRRAEAAWRALLVSLAVATCATSARAQSRGFAVGRYEPSERGSAWFVVDDLDLRGGPRPAFGATLDLAHKPLAVRDARGEERFALVETQLFLHLGGAIVLVERLRLALNAPVALVQDGEGGLVAGETLDPARGASFGDVRLGADLRVAGARGDLATVAIGLRSWLPTGSPSRFTGDSALRLGPHVLVAGDAGRLAWAARAAFVFRARDDAYAGRPLGSELAFSAGVGLRLGATRQVLVGPELFATTVTAGSAFLSSRGTPADVVLGAHVTMSSGLRVGGALGGGLSSGLGSPAFRALLSAEWGAPPPVAAAPTPPPEDDFPAGTWTNPQLSPSAPKPQEPLAVVTETEIQIREQVRFATDSAELAAESDPVLDAVRRLLVEHPEVRRLRVEGHTDDTGDPSYNEDLGRRRAAAVVTWLVEHGVDGARLESAGFGSKVPLDSNATEAGRARNRRVVFTILERTRP